MATTCEAPDEDAVDAVAELPGLVLLPERLATVVSDPADAPDAGIRSLVPMPTKTMNEWNRTNQESGNFYDKR